MATILLDAGYVLYKFGGWMGPENFVTTDNKMQNNVTELVNNLAQIAVDGKWDGANVLFRLASIVDVW
jgi:D-mannonate dehydratase